MNHCLLITDTPEAIQSEKVLEGTFQEIIKEIVTNTQKSIKEKLELLKNELNSINAEIDELTNEYNIN